jgi:hypothetical protein
VKSASNHTVAIVATRSTESSQIVNKILGGDFVKSSMKYEESVVTG